MSKTFWLDFAIQNLITLAEAFVASSALSPKKKADVEKLIAAAQVVVTDVLPA